MYDLERIGNIIASIEKQISEIESYNISSQKELEDGKTYHASAMLCFAILNKVIDLGGELISAKNLGAPNTYQDIMPLLAKGGVINKKQADDLNKLIRKRNVLAHFYEDIKEKELYEIIDNLDLVREFLRIVKKQVLKN